MRESVQVSFKFIQLFLTQVLTSTDFTSFRKYSSILISHCVILQKLACLNDALEIFWDKEIN